MISLSASGGSITFTFSGNSGYLQDGVITVPVNSLTLVTDNSEMATFRKSASNDIFISALYSDFGMTKEQLVSFYKNNMVGSTGGGGGGITSGEVESMIDEAVSGKQDTLSAGTGIDITDNVISATGGGEDTVSAFTRFKKAIIDNQNYGAFQITSFRLKNSSNSWGGGTALELSVEGNSSSAITIEVYHEGLPITGITPSSNDCYTSTIENGEAVITLTSGKYVSKIVYYGDSTKAYYFKEYSSGTTSSVIQNTIYDAVGELSDYNVTNLITNVSADIRDEGFYTTITNQYGTSANRIQDVSSPTINTKGGKINVQFSGDTPTQMILNTGDSSYCQLLNVNFYSKAFDDLTVGFSSGWTGGGTYLRVGFIDVNGSSSSWFRIVYDNFNHTIDVPTDLANYGTVEDNVSTNNSFKITANSGYRISYFADQNCSICGVDNPNPDDYAVNLVTATTYIYDGQAIIDNILQRLSALENNN